jgi:hypothetical protein
MLKQLAILFAAITVFAAAFLLVERSSSPFFQSCISEGGGDKGEETAKESHHRISSVVIRYVRCTGRFVDGHGVGITAIFTIVLSASTILLWIVTNKAAEAAKAAAEHIPVVEGAFVYVLKVEEDLFGDRLNWIEKDQFEGGMPRVQIRLKNFGKTPAFIERFAVHLNCIGTDINVSGKEVHIQPNTIIGAGEESPPASSPSLRIEITLTAAQATRIKKGSAAILLRGTLVYSDIWESQWTAPFDGRYDAESGSFRLDNYIQTKSA